MREAISTSDAPASPLFSQAIKAGQHIYVSGLVGVDVATPARYAAKLGAEIPAILVSIRMTAVTG